jgi:hypothetical protein
VSSAFDLKSRLDAATVCGMSSSLRHVTVVPTFTERRAGEKVKLSMVAVASSVLTKAWEATARVRTPASKAAAAGNRSWVVDGTESLQQLKRPSPIVGAPAPLFVDRPQWNVCEHHNWRLRRFSLEIVRQPLELLVPEIAEPTRLEVHDIDETDEMHAARVKTVPARALGVLAIVLTIELRIFIEEVVLAGNIMHVETDLGDHSLGIVELGRLGDDE